MPPPYVVTPPTTPSGSHPGANATAYLFFDLDSDPTESSPANAASYRALPECEGFVCGRASLNADEFVAVATAGKE